MIFHLLQSKNKGGMESVFVEYSKMIKKYDDLICICPQNFPYNEILKNNNIKVINLDITGHFDFIGAFKLLSLIKKYNPKLLIAHNGRYFSVINILKNIRLLKNIKTLAVSHGGSIKRIVNFDYVIAVAKHIERKIKKTNFKGEVKTIYTGIKSSNKSNKKEKASDKNIFTIGTLSRLSTEKNLGIVIKSFSNFREKNPNSKLIIAGDGEEKEKLLGDVEKMGLQNYVEFPGWIDNKERFFNNLDLFIQASTQESFGLTILESFNHNCPVLASKTLGPSEIINDNKNGFLFYPINEKQLTKKIQYIFNNKNLIKNITIQAKKDLIDKFEITVTEKNLIDFLKYIKN